ncbi:hypothetical protein CC78DRAFT_579085 [Lojkania enalia]|uniref:Uncharacterized protein n=1 Tax=Lojkania enalia TaxID=147567 RepID=A0A9P4N129_9PLEO|nr:hypothetical protein CC78DRAFT_579085 [Didymosphaeria enalia]
MAAQERLHQHQAFPPSPPPSPPRRRHKKAQDRFLELENTLTASPSPTSSLENEEDENQTYLEKIILTPILMISFLLSLFLINRSDRARRTNSHPTSQKSSLLSYFFPSTYLDPEPYQDPTSTTWTLEKPSAPHPSLSNAQHGAQLGRESRTQSWHLHKKIRKVARLEISDAFEMRGRVIAAMIAVMLVLVLSACMGLRWVVRKVVG